MPKRTSKQPKTTRGAGRPPGSRNKANLVIQDLTAEIAGARGKLRMKWVQGTDSTGKPLFEMRDKLDAKGKPIIDKYGNIRRELCRDKDGKPVPIMYRVRMTA